MSGLRSDMSGSGAGYVRSTETSCSEKVDNMELREITGTIRSNLNSRIQL
jgi:hypothetical protein